MSLQKNSIKKLGLNFIVFCLWFWATLKNLFVKNKATHVFYYSKNYVPRHNYLLDFDMQPLPTFLFKGKKYTYVVKFKEGFCEDINAKILGIGSLNDISVSG